VSTIIEADLLLVLICFVLVIDFWAAMLFLPDMVKRKKGHFLSVSSTMGYGESGPLIEKTGHCS
jgi:short-subunit dehydrogenase